MRISNEPLRNSFTSLVDKAAPLSHQENRILNNSDSKQKEYGDSPLCLSIVESNNLDEDTHKIETRQNDVSSGKHDFNELKLNLLNIENLFDEHTPKSRDSNQ